MDEQQSFSMDKVVALGQSLADPARVRILALMVTNGEMCSSDLEQILEFTQSKTSRHLRHLADFGLISPRREDQWTYYDLSGPLKSTVLDLLGRVVPSAQLQQDQKIYTTLYANNILAKRKLHNRLGKYQLPEL